MAENDPTPIAEISHGPSAFEQFLDRNQKSLVVVGILLALAAGAWVVMDGMKQGARQAAGNALVDATELDAMEAVVADHADTPSAPSAEVLLSDLQWEQGQQTAAIETLRAEIDANPDHPATVPARARLGARLKAQGDLDAAKGVFEDLVQAPEASWVAPYALLSLSDIARSQGNQEEAESLIKQAADAYPASPFSQQVQQALQFVDFKMPEEVDPPAPEPAADADLPEIPEVPDTMDPASSGTPSNPLLEALDPGTSDEAPEAPDSAQPETDAPAGE